MDDYSMLKYLFILLFLFISTFIEAQVSDGLVAKYSFNQGKFEDDLGTHDVKAVGVSSVEDRFGNPKHACYLHGNFESYLNLGTSSALKPTTGSISVWVRIENIMHKGSGFDVNPIILTKSHVGDDFFEGYFIGVDINTKKISASSSFDSTHQVSVWSADTFSRHSWHHIVMSYDNQFMWLYMDNVLEIKMAKNFQSRFLKTDSIMIGNTANSKNKRFLNASVDDIEIFNRVLNPEEVAALYNAPDPNRYHQFTRLLFFVLAGVFILVIIIWLMNLWYKKKFEKEKEKTRLASQNYEMEIKVIKAQMNPHFIFNSLNSIQHFIIDEKKEKAQLYLSKFSKLIRKMLETNTNESISLSDEVELLSHYLEIESLRFSNMFNYTISFEGKIDTSKILIPHFLVQPFVENAIWHGLLVKKGEKELHIKFKIINERTLSCVIDDNGVGRKKFKPGEGTGTQKSLAIHFIQQRLELLNKIYQVECGITIIDKMNGVEPAGTQVIIRLPIINNSYVKSDNHR